MVVRPKIAKKIMTVIKDTTGVIRVIEKYEQEYIVYYVQTIDKETFVKIKRYLTPEIVEKIEKSKKIGDIENIKSIKNNRYRITWSI